MIKFTLNGKTNFIIESCSYGDYKSIVETFTENGIEVSIKEQLVPLSITTKTEQERNKIIKLLSKNEKSCLDGQSCADCGCVTCTKKYLESVIKVVN